MSKKISPKKIIIFLVLFLLFVWLLINYITWREYYNNRVYPNVSINKTNLEGLTFFEVKNKINDLVSNIQRDALIFKYNNKSISIGPDISSFDSDLSYSILSFNINSTTEKAFDNKLHQTFLDYLKHKLQNKTSFPIQASYILDKPRLKKLLEKNFPELNIPAHNAYFSINSKGEIETNFERIGKEIDYSFIWNQLENNLNNLNNSPIIIKTKTKYPIINKEVLAPLKPQVKKIIHFENFFLNYKNKTWPIKKEKFISWLKTDKTGLSLEVDFEKVKKYLEIKVSPEINKKVIRPKFEITNNKVTKWVKGENGQQINIEKTFLAINKTLKSKQASVPIVVDIINNNDYVSKSGFQIKNLLGTGYSSFAGSPNNRIHNISIGARTVHGTLIKPDEEFSLVKTLGNIDKKSGYLPELVIKDNKTIPEYGGGLCQIGTTMFRAALSSGLPITERRNHSYRVSYYEPAGTDATIYDPKPDLRFKNDTGHYILIQSKIDGNNLYFSFWGVSDHRVATTTYPIIYNITKPKPTKIIETTDLPLGEKKCTEHSHNGADAYFDYTVYYPDNKKLEKNPVVVRFKSHYAPWQEVCLVGVEATLSTSTLSNIKTD